MPLIIGVGARRLWDARRNDEAVEGLRQRPEHTAPVLLEHAGGVIAALDKTLFNTGHRVTTT